MCCSLTVARQSADWEYNIVPKDVIGPRLKRNDDRMILKESYIKAFSVLKTKGPAKPGSKRQQYGMGDLVTVDFFGDEKGFFVHSILARVNDSSKRYANCLFQ